MKSGWYFLLLILLSACAATGPESPLKLTEMPPLVWPAAPEPARIKFVTQFDNADNLGMQKSFFSKLKDWFAGAEDNRMHRPYAIAVNSKKIIVADPDATAVHIFDLKRKRYRKIDKVGKWYFRSPISVALGENRLFISDSILNKVFILDNNFQPIKILQQFKRPTGLAFDSTRQQLYVTDTLAHQVQVLDKNGEFLFRIGQRGEQDAQFNFPTHLAFRDDRLFVNDTMNFRIQIFNHDGTHLKTFGRHGDGTGAFSQSKGVSVDSDGHVYVADNLTNRVQIFDQNGIFLLDFGSLGNTPGRFQLPAGLAFWDDKIYVADSYNKRIQVFQYLAPIYSGE